MRTGDHSLKVLIIEDNETDVLFTVRYLKQQWAEVNHLRIDKLDELRGALKQDWDIILCDFNLPGFDGMTALRTIREYGIKVPFILVSGEVAEDVASLMMRLGANDYVMKDNLSRLAPAIIRELKSAKGQEEEKTAGNEPLNKIQKGPAVSDKLLPPLIPEETKVITERHKAVINMLFVTEFIRKNQEAILEKQKLTLPRLNILRILRRAFPEEMNIKMIKEEMVYKTVDLSRLIEKMKQEGLINVTDRKPNTQTKQIVIAVKGLGILEMVDKHNDEIFLPENYLAEEDAQKINEALREVMWMIKQPKA